MAPTKRMAAIDRREAIVHAVAPVFAEKGFDGATTRNLALAAGVSEALLYRHFPSKESLYGAIGLRHLRDRDLHPGFEEVLAMAPSTERLVQAVRYLIAHMVEPARDPFPRLMAQSLMGDGAFARSALAKFQEEFFGFLTESAQAAKETGDLVEGVVVETLGFWMLQHLAMALRFIGLPGEPAVAYGCSREALVEEATSFALRGLGLKPGAIETYRQSNPPRDETPESPHTQARSEKHAEGVSNEVPLPRGI